MSCHVLGFRGRRLSTWWECLVSCSFFLWCSIEQENASVLFSHILQPKGNPFLVCVVLFFEFNGFLFCRPSCFLSRPSLHSRWPTKQEAVKFEEKNKTKQVKEHPEAAEDDWKELRYSPVLSYPKETRVHQTLPPSEFGHKSPQNMTGTWDIYTLCISVGTATVLFVYKMCLLIGYIFFIWSFFSFQFSTCNLQIGSSVVHVTQKNFISMS